MRLAGNKPGYSFRLVNHEGEVTEHGFELVSVTTVIKTFLGGPPPEWGFKMALEGVLSLVNEDGLVLNGYSYEELKAELKERAMTPWHARDAGAVRGTRVHSYLEHLGACEHEGDVATPEDGYERAVLDWWLAERPTVVAQEVPLYSLRYGFAGTVDLIYQDQDGNRVLCDLKTHKPKSKGKPAYLDDLLQVGAYRVAWNEMHPDQPIHREVVLLAAEDGTPHVDGRGGDPQGFLALLRMYQAGLR